MMESIEKKRKKKRNRRAAVEIIREFVCFAEGCGKAYGTEGALKIHLRLKHSNLPIPPKDEFLLRCQVAKAANTPNSVMPPYLYEEDKLFSCKSLTDCFNVPLEKVKMGAWEKSALISWNMVGTFSFFESKLSWKFSMEFGLMRVDIPFSSITGLIIENLPDNSIAFGVAIKDPPQFYQLVNIDGFDKPFIWCSCGDFTGGCALVSKLHCLLIPKDKFPPALQFLLFENSITRNFLQAGLPVVQQPEFLIFTLQTCSEKRAGPYLYSSPHTYPYTYTYLLESSSCSEPSSPSNSSPGNSCSPNSSLSTEYDELPPYQPSRTVETLSFSECSIAHRNSILALPLNRRITLNCCQTSLTLKELLSSHQCLCRVNHYYSFCQKTVLSCENWSHCIECGRCTQSAFEHCIECNSCNKERCDQCAKWEFFSDFPLNQSL
jgi:hypothetical protein